jgi:hypothetical protein
MAVRFHSLDDRKLLFDSLTISLVERNGVAPAVLGFTLGLRGGWDVLKYFEGTPIPTSILIVVILGVAFSHHAIESATWFGAYRLGPATVPH